MFNHHTRLRDLTSAGVQDALTAQDPDAKMAEIAKRIYNALPEQDKREICASETISQVRDKRFRTPLAYEIYLRGIKEIQAAKRLFSPIS